ncbi:MAG: oligosaccharide flippase family protein [Candidatus Paceibacterota bacterium]
MFQDWKDRFTRFLLWSQKYTKTDMLYLAHGGFWLTLGQGVSSLSTLALAVAFANLVPPETYGAYKYILSIASIFAIFSLPGMQKSVSRAAARGHAGVIHGTTRQRVLFSLIGSIAALATSAYYLLNENVELSLALLIIAVALPIFDTFTGYIAHFAGVRRFDLQTKYYALTQTVSVTVLIATLFFTNNLIFILLGYFLPLAIIRMLLYWNITRSIPKEIDATEEKQSLTYGKHLTAMNILGVVAGNIDKILLWKFLGPAQLAIYAFAIAIPEQFKGPLRGVGDLAFPKFATQTPEQMGNALSSLWWKLGVYALILCATSIAYIMLAPYIFKLLFPLYMESVIYSQIYALSLISAVSVIPIAALEAQKKTVTQYFLNTIQSVTSVVLMVVLTPIFGVLGVVCGIVIGRLVSTIYVIGTAVYMFKRQ